MDPVALIGLAGLLFLKEAGLPIPIPGDLLVVAAGVSSADQGLPAAVVLVAIVVAGDAGGSMQFLLVRGALRRALLSVLARLGVGRERLDALAGWLARRGARGVAVARATPAVRVGAIAASGLAGLSYPVFLRGLIVGNGVFVTAHFALGYLIGPPAQRLFAGIGGFALGLVVLVVFAVLGAAGWNRLRRHAASPPPATSRGGYGGWVEAACPACLVFTAVRPDLAEGDPPVPSQA